MEILLLNCINITYIVSKIKSGDFSSLSNTRATLEFIDVGFIPKGTIGSIVNRQEL